MRAGDGLQQRALARPVRADQPMEAARLDLQVDAIQRLQRAIGFGDAGDLEQRHQPASFRPKEPMRSREDTTSPSNPVGWKVTTTSSTTPRMTGQNCRIASVSAST